jgi:hypothetical protein
MRKLWAGIAAVGLMWGVSAVPSAAVICSGTCTTTFVNGSGNYGDTAPTANFNGGTQFLDQYAFTLAGPPPSAYSSFTDTIIASTPINDLVLSIFDITTSTTVGSQAGPAVGVPGETVILTLTNALFPGDQYYIQVVGDFGAGIHYDGTQDITPGTSERVTTPLPAALPLFAGGLGLLGFWGRRRKGRSA